MKRFGYVLVTAGCLGLLAGGAVEGQRRHEPTGPDSFLRFQVESTDELVAVLKTNAALRQRYARHFGVSEAEVVDYIKRSLIPYRLPRARTLTVYGVTKTGRVYGVRQRVAKGTRVWANRSGHPVLKWLCANPITHVLPAVHVATAPRTSVTRRIPGKIAALPLDAAEPPALDQFALLPPAAPGYSLEGGGGLGGAGLAALPAAPPASLVAGSLEQLASGGLNLVPALLLPLVAIAGGGGGGGGVTPVAVPEPGALALLAGTAPVLMTMILRRRRRTPRTA